MTTRIYAGIGARATPAATLRDMSVMAGWLARTGWHLATGAAAQWHFLSDSASFP